MLSLGRCVLIGLVVLAPATTPGQEACQERILSLRFSPPAGHANNWCWAASGQMIMELLGEEPKKACQCRQAEQVLGVKGCCVTPSSCVPAEELPARCDRPRWPAFVEKSELFSFGYTTTCDALKDRQDDEACSAWATSSLPTPVSPRRSTGPSPARSARICSWSLSVAAEWPGM